ncbi:non-specific serine/threonine protein kinase NDAI_0E02390 [Naumovozyma dairenensis CBS 421]|uniref:non-specific serine/threonine protein kinase n=1 Tax=Naumovozyma dairenensis (strain ATCC 10597 / BCRC 20456 / CBS 421 / NBRC 0211 / NRRL Y-12639) TaxID=1071378 RepID=G0WBD6_NAUDC|nr:hypothetical protein NDAI_0E02390 [Naumovozyma dairenensis CBS 421]CCD25056.1 hypothetical protein NDAI_0E02390 [Naumovozyma dairenensis CBS 421]
MNNVTQLEQNNIKSIIGASYNRLYGQFTSPDLKEVGNYKILDQIGEGSFGKVYLASHRLTHCKVVLKTSNKSDPNIVREVFYHRQFDYPYITQLYEVIVTESKVWMAQEYCPGKDLYDHVLSLQRVPSSACIELFTQIVGAVYYAHSLNCVHRDLKLENILLDKNGNAKLTDFGFTRECMTKTSLETICGTTVYMAPELIKRESYDGFKIDIWSLGVILYTMLNGSMPFDEDDETKTEWKIMNEMPVFNDTILSEDAKDLLIKLLSKDPNERPSMQEILHHPFLQPYGSLLLEKTDRLLRKQRNGTIHFHSKLERKLLKNLKRTGFDTQAMKVSVQKRKSDLLSATWTLLLQREKRHEKVNQPKRSRSLLSVRKVFESSSPNIGQDLLKETDDLRELKLVKSISRRISKRIDPSLPSGKKSFTSLDDQEQKENTASKPLSRIDSSVSKETTPGKNNIFKKMSKFFKQKKYLNNSTPDSNTLTSNYGDTRSPSTSISNSYRRKNSESPVKDITSVKTSETTIKKNSPINSKTSPSKSLKNAKAQTDDSARHKMQGTKLKESITIAEPNLKKLKSIVSSDFSRSSLANYDSESVDNSYFLPNEDKRAGRSGSGRARPLSFVSQISNDTYNSEYSTDGNTSSIKFEDPMKGTNDTSGTLQQSPKLGDNIITGYHRKFIRRDLSVISGASSTSERSSRTDSFYDITTTTLPITKNVRMIKSGSLKESVLPRFGSQRSWTGKRSYIGSRHGGTLGRRNSKRYFLASPPNETDNVIQEESSSEESVPISRNNGLSLTNRLNSNPQQIRDNTLDSDDENIGPHSDSEAVNSNIRSAMGRSNIFSAGTERSTSGEIIWSPHNDDSKSVISEGTDHCEVDNADNEDNILSDN